MDRRTRKLLYKDEGRGKGKLVFFTLLIVGAIWLVSRIPDDASGSAVAAAPRLSPITTVETPAAQTCEDLGSCIELKLLSGNCYEEYGFWVMEGELRNVSAAPLKNVLANVSFTGKGQFIKADSALIAYDPLMPGQTSPFKVMTTANPLIDRCQVNFQQMFGERINHTYKPS